MTASSSITHGGDAQQRPARRHDRFGNGWTDEHDWLRDPGWPDVTDPAILAHLEAENDRFEAAMAPHRALIDTLAAELKARVPAEDASVPVREGGFEYRWRYRSGAEYRVWERRPAGSDEAGWRTILDENAEAAGRRYFALRSLSASPDGRLLAYATDEDGSERYAIHLEDLATGERLADLVRNTAGSIVWAEDGRTLLYVELNELLRPWRVRGHRLGSDPAGDAVLFEETDPAFFVSIDKTLDRRWIVIGTGSHVTTESWLVDAARPDQPPRLVAARRKGHRYRVDHAHGRLWILTDDLHPNFRLVSVPADAPDEAGWRQEIAADDAHYLQDHRCFDGFMLLRERRDGMAGLRLRRWDGSEHLVPFPDAAGSPQIGDNREFVTATARLTYSSMVTPPTVYDLDAASLKLTVRKQLVPPGYDAALYATEALIARAADGTAVPISLLRRRDAPGGGPLLLYGYGAYGHGLDASFQHTRLSLVDRGFAYALAHVRGGDEKGPRWWQDGKLQAKPNTFTDFVACAEALVAAGHARAGEIAIKGTSAGGLLIGAVLNLRQDLWRCAIAEVPFVDVLHTMLDASLLLTPIEWPEWGDPIRDEQAFATIRGYSPYDNVAPLPYPEILATAGLSDPRVGYWEPAKWIARLRRLSTGEGRILLRTHMDAGHGGRSGRYEALADLAEQYAFVLSSFAGRGGGRAPGGGEG
ncbi:MAG: S9 family peptidase [Geminicoccaceae bacterium]